MQLAGDGHVHSEWSFDTGGPAKTAGRMVEMCERAIAIGLPALTFTDHLELSPWAMPKEDLLEHLWPLVDESGVITVDPFDIDGYLDSVDRCRHQFPQLRILTGVEFGQPHLDESAARQLVDLDALDRINGSLHSIAVNDSPDSIRSEPITLYRAWSPERVVRTYLTEALAMVSRSLAFSVFCHIDYAVRYWPKDQVGPFNPYDFEDEFRHVMRALAESDRALELNVGGPIRPWIPQWWSEEGGRAITFGSDAHIPSALAGNFYEAMAMAECFGFRPGPEPEDFWRR